jgi:hypothetical protein
MDAATRLDSTRLDGANLLVASIKRSHGRIATPVPVDVILSQLSAQSAGAFSTHLARIDSS